MSSVLNSRSSDDEGLPSHSWTDYIQFEDLELDKQSELGAGAFGTVYKGVYFGVTVAVKKIKIPTNDQDLMRFLKREVVILKHPHIVQFVGVCKHNNSLLLITEYAQGGDLHQCLKDSRLYGLWKTKVTLSQQVASAMAYLHSKSVVFRDLKAKNVLVNDKTHPTQAKLCDFGFARVLTKVDGPRNNTNYLTICGTDDWMAPEVILGMDYDEKSDVFSYGILLLEMIIGTKTLKRELKRNPMTGFELDLNRVRSLAARTCPAKFLELAIFCCEYQPKNRPDFKSIVMAFSKILQDPAVVDLSPEAVMAAYDTGNAKEAKKEATVVLPSGPDPTYTDGAYNSTMTMHVKHSEYTAPPKEEDLFPPSTPPKPAVAPKPTPSPTSPPPLSSSPPVTPISQQQPLSPNTSSNSLPRTWTNVLEQIVSFFAPTATNPPTSPRGENN